MCGVLSKISNHLIRYGVRCQHVSRITVSAITVISAVASRVARCRPDGSDACDPGSVTTLSARHRSSRRCRRPPPCSLSQFFCLFCFDAPPIYWMIDISIITNHRCWYRHILLSLKWLRPLRNSEFLFVEKFFNYPCRDHQWNSPVYFVFGLLNFPSSTVLMWFKWSKELPVSNEVSVGLDLF